MATAVPTIVVAALALSGALFVVLGIPLMRRRMPPNGLYGLRVNATFADERVWYEANAASGRDLALLGALLVLLAILLPVFGLNEHLFVLWWTATTLIGVLVVCVVGIRRANKLLRSLHEKA